MSTHPGKAQHKRALAFAVAAVALIASACGSTSSNVVAGQGDLGHIHDMVVGPDDELLVATHSGLYRIDGPDRAVLVGTDQHDLMSMAADDNALIAGGHPDLRVEEFRIDGQPPFLGLARSTDGGESWQIVDLLGDADFHALASTNVGLFAAEGNGQIWLLDATGEWTQLGEVQARDLAVNPADPDQQLAPDYDGALWASNDMAASWTLVSDAPPIIEVEWIDDTTIVGVTEAGVFWSAEDPIGQWTQAASLSASDETSRVETFYVDPSGDWWVGMEGGAIARSMDNGANWEQVYLPPN